jgi:hypothetical protein
MHYNGARSFHQLAVLSTDTKLLNAMDKELMEEGPARIDKNNPRVCHSVTKVN